MLQVICTKLKILCSLVSQRVSLTASVDMLVVYAKGSPAPSQLPLCPGCDYFKSSRLLSSNNPNYFSINCLYCS